MVSSRWFPGDLAKASAPSEMSPITTERSERSIISDGGGDCGCLLPLLDNFNHKYGSEITWTATPEQGVSFQMGSDISAGSEVFNNYGAKDNEAFLLGYGFCTRHNPADSVAVQLGCEFGNDNKTMILSKSDDFVLRQGDFL